MLNRLKSKLRHFVRGDAGYTRATYIGGGRLLVKTRVGPLLISSSDLSLMPFLALHGTFEDELVNWLQRTLQPGDTFVDIGANVGWFTVIGARAVGESGHVVAVEADARNFDILLENVSMNYVAPRVRAVHAAATDTAGTVALFVASKFRGNSSIVELDRDYLERYPGDHVQTVEVPAIRLDDLLHDQEYIHVLKMDIEGAEVRALAGCAELIAGGRVKHLVLEINRFSSGGNWAAFSDWLRSHEESGWTIFDLAGGVAVSADHAIAVGSFHNVVLSRSEP